MCMFSGPVGHVKNTRIFARLSGIGTQFLVYSMSYAADTEIAMILPIPVGSRNEDNAVRFISLENYPKFFEDMIKGFPYIDPSRQLIRSMLPASASVKTLEVHTVGEYEASFVPSLSDFDRLDSRFKLPETIWDQMPQYADYGFAVFKLRRTEKKQGEEAHPMAFEFMTRHHDSLFFPTVHVHDGQVHPYEQFHHHLYCQGIDKKHQDFPEPEYFHHGVPKKSTEFLPGEWNAIGTKVSYTSYVSADQFLNVQKADGIVDGQEHCHVTVLDGMLPNEDTILRKGTLV